MNNINNIIIDDYNTITKTLKQTKKFKLQWIYRDENDIYYDPEMEQYYTQIDLTQNKTIDIVLTKRLFSTHYYNLYIEYYLNSLKPLYNIIVKSIYYQNTHNLFDLFTYVKYDNVFGDDFFKENYTGYFHSNYNNFVWKKIKGINDNFLYRTVLEKCKYKNKEVFILVTSRSFVIYKKEINGKNEDRKIINRIFDGGELYNILSSNL